MNRSPYRVTVANFNKPRPQWKSRPMTPAEITEHQLGRIVALGASIRESAWEAAQAQLAAIRHVRRTAPEVAHA